MCKCDRPSIILAGLKATITALVSFELAIRGDLSPGNGFAAKLREEQLIWLR